MDSYESARLETFTRPEPCGQDGCPRKRYYEQDGQIYCLNGHAQGITIQHAQEEEDFVAPSSQGRTTRLKKEPRAKQSRIVGGVSALNLYLLCYQHLLRLQCQALISLKGVNPELEQIVRELWMLRQMSIQKTVGKSLKRAEDAADATDDEAPTLYSSQGESTQGDTTDTEGVPRLESRRKVPSLVDSLSLCYMGMILLRTPISIGELHRWAVREEVPFIRPLRLIPSDIHRNLSTRWVNLLETHHALHPDDLHNSLQRLISQYQRPSMAVTLPSLNYQPLLSWYIQQLALPPQSQTIVQHLVTLLDFDFSFPAQQPRERRIPLPELQLISLLIISVKLYHPFPPTPRCYAVADTDPAYLMLDWEIWSLAYESHAASVKTDDSFEPGEQMYLREADVFALNGAQMDEWMDWYGGMYPESGRLDGTAKDQIPKELKDLFPITRPDKMPSASRADEGERLLQEKRVLEERQNKVLSAQKMRTLVSVEREEKISQKKGAVPRAGDKYQIFEKEEDLIPFKIGRQFHEAMAERAAVSVEKLLKEVRKIEQALERKERQDKAKMKSTAS